MPLGNSISDLEGEEQLYSGQYLIPETITGNKFNGNITTVTRSGLENTMQVTEGFFKIIYFYA